MCVCFLCTEPTNKGPTQWLIFSGYGACDRVREMIIRMQVFIVSIDANVCWLPSRAYTVGPFVSFTIIVIVNLRTLFIVFGWVLSLNYPVKTIDTFCSVNLLCDERNCWIDWLNYACFCSHTFRFSMACGLIEHCGAVQSLFSREAAGQNRCIHRFDAREYHATW